MSMNTTPVIRIEMEGIRAGVMHHMRQHNEEFNSLVQETLANTLTEEWGKHSIQEAVNNVVRTAISNLGDNWNLQNAINKVLADALVRMVEGKGGTTDAGK